MLAVRELNKYSLRPISTALMRDLQDINTNDCRNSYLLLSINVAWCSSNRSLIGETTIYSSNVSMKVHFYFCSMHD